jgi:toxin HigB-1
MIESFASSEAEKIFKGIVSKKLPLDMQKTARRKLLYLEDAEDLRDLLAPPGNRLEELRGDRAGQHSIRINDQWRICFRWVNGKARDVEIVDYHR